MSAKAPIYLKRSSRKGKLRDFLSPDMISPPLGDFRHTIHIGSGEGDTFGDISFLQGKFHLLPQSTPGSSTTSSDATPPTSHADLLNPTPCHSDLLSPLLKNAISLPAIGGPQALSLPPSPPTKPPRLHLDDTNKGSLGDVEENCPVDVSAKNRFSAEESEERILAHAGSILSLHVDLGPSIMEDVLQVMDQS
uniref:Cdc42 effector protein 2 n=1 Tax=Xenopus laevis TaxID=8355 RepID=B1H1W0_XENLA|nr:Unknown (protein for MGC:180039) [Xenopus laevis]AAI70001.1 Unknown (protein for MGC:196728) [Xenopus laevis]